MKQLTKNEIKDNFLSILAIVQKGEDIIVTGDKDREKLAVIVPYQKYHQKSERVLAPLKGKAGYKIKENFKINDEELLSL
ncbi:MAG: hypothetical protein R2941_24860 [Desulfobacterales bacterium]